MFDHKRTISEFDRGINNLTPVPNNPYFIENPECGLLGEPLASARNGAHSFDIADGGNDTAGIYALGNQIDYMD